MLQLTDTSEEARNWIIQKAKEYMAGEKSKQQIEVEKRTFTAATKAAATKAAKEEEKKKAKEAGKEAPVPKKNWRWRQTCGKQERKIAELLAVKMQRNLRKRRKKKVQLRKMQRNLRRRRKRKCSSKK